MLTQIFIVGIATQTLFLNPRHQVRNWGKRMSAKMSIEIKTKWEVNSQSELKKSRPRISCGMFMWLCWFASVYQHYTCRKKSASNFSYMCPSRERIYNHTAYIYWWTWRKNRFKKSPPNKQFIPHTIYLLYDSAGTKKRVREKIFIHHIKPKLYFYGFKAIERWKNEKIYWIK